MARPKTESSAGLWTDEDDIKTLLLLAKSGRVNFKDMISEKHSPEAAQEVYDRLASEENFPIGVLFDWRKI
jgi:threonine dehydrogenase-like Zn-dependent dehydrogenase